MRGSGTFKRPDILNQEHKVSKAEQELNEAEEALRAVKNAKQEAECRLSEAHETCNNAVQLISEVLPFSAVLLDLRLDPQVDQLVGFEWLTGFQLLRQLKDRFPHVPVILLTASERARSAEFAVKLGAEAYWTKGVSSGEDLRQVILRCVNKAPNRKRWAKLKVIEGKPSVHCRRLPGQTDIWLDRRMPRRGDLQAFLDEAFLIICTHAGRSENEHVLPRPWNAVFRGLGVVQEIRCQNVEGEWDQMGREEREYRERRNKFTHVPLSDGMDFGPQALGGAPWLRGAGIPLMKNGKLRLLQIVSTPERGRSFVPMSDSTATHTLPSGVAQLGWAHWW